jgi:tetratricopeptide (TPR) repeat protein
LGGKLRNFLAKIHVKSKRSYNPIVTRMLFVACLCGFFFTSASFGQAKQPAAVQAPAAQPPAEDEQMPPEEDESLAPETFPLNPLESERNIKVGNYYWHKGNFRAALQRYERATKYNPSSADAFFKVGEAEEKLKNKDAAKAAFQRVIQIAPDSKTAHEAKKKLGEKT